MISEQLAAFLESNGIGTQGQSIFVNMMPLDCQQGILIRPEFSGIKYDYELPGYYKGRIRLIARSHTYQGAMTLIANALATLPTSGGQIDTADIRFIRPIALPVGFPVTLGNYYEALVDLDLAYSDGV